MVIFFASFAGLTISLIEKRLKSDWLCFFLSLKPRFLDSNVFFWLSFGYNDKYWLIVLVRVLVNVAINKNLYFNFNFGFISFFDPNIPTI